ncbi:MAG: DUF6599 family protein [Phycisphaerae bacterium]
MRGPLVPIVALASLGWLSCGCKPDEPPAQPSSTSADKPNQPQSAPITLPTRLPSLAPHDRPPQPAPEAPAAGAPPASSAVPARATPPAAPPADFRPANAPPGVDGSDLPGAPGFLPRTYEVPGWRKSEPITRVAASDMTRLFSQEHARRIGHFHFRTITRCAYQLITLPTGNTLRVIAIEAETPEDAFGLVTCGSNSSQFEPIGGLTRVDPGPALTLHIWQGRVALQATLDSDPPLIRDEVRTLLHHIVSRIPREELPQLAQAMPPQSLLPGRLWLVRDVRSLAPTAIGLSPAPDFDTLARLITPGGDAWLCVASFHLPGARRPNTCFVVQYPSARAAREAHGRLAAHLSTATSPAWQSINVMPPRGAFLIGTWSADEESLQYQMPKIAQLLPA